MSDAPGTTRDVVADRSRRGASRFASSIRRGSASRGLVEQLGVDRARAPLRRLIVVMLIDPGGDVEAQTWIRAIEPRRGGSWCFRSVPPDSGLRAGLRGEAWDALPTSSRSGEGIVVLGAWILGASPFGGAARSCSPRRFSAATRPLVSAARPASGAPRARAAEILESSSQDRGRLP